MTFYKDEYLIVLDFLPRGHATGKMEPLAQGIGERYFTLLEVVTYPNITLKTGDRIYIGSEKRNEVAYIKRKLAVNEMTNVARLSLPDVVKQIVKSNEKRFVDFFNNAHPITTRMHQLELLHGIGKKVMWAIIEEREKEPFKSFDDIKTRVQMTADPVESIVKRILQEIESDDEKYYIFVAKHPKTVA
jgi:putative nucleotide binding protein